MARPTALFLIVALLASLALAGCVRHDKATGGGPATADSMEPSRPTTPVEPDNRFVEPVRPKGLLATNCTGWQTGQRWPGLDPPPARPDSWTPSDPAVATVSLHGFDCKRISYGGLERGPVQLVIESTNHFDAPEDCTKADRTTSNRLVYSIGSTDAGLADLLSRQLGAPTYVIEYRHATNPSPDGSFEVVSWAPPGQTASSLTIDHPPGTVEGLLIPDRFFWQNGTGIIGLDLAYQGFEMDGGDKPVYGSMEPPMKLAAAYPLYHGLSGWFTDMSATGTLYSWSDFECKHPSGSQSPS